MPNFHFTDFNSYESNGLINCSVCFVPAITINCNPPYIKGKKQVHGLSIGKMTVRRIKKNLKSV